MKNLNLEALKNDTMALIELLNSGNYTHNDLVDYIADVQYESKKMLDKLAEIEEEEE